MRIVIDTNILVASAYAANSASRRIVEACEAGRLVPLFSPAIRAEYEQILPRAIRRPAELTRILALIAAMELVHPTETPRVVETDPADDKFLAAAATGQASHLITNDRAVLEVGEYQGVTLLRPSEFASKVSVEFHTTKPLK